MTIEDIIKANTAALIENTAALREILSVGASTAAVQAVPEKSKRTKVDPPLKIEKTDEGIKGTVDLGGIVKSMTEEPAKGDAPEPECPAPAAEEPVDNTPDPVTVPELPPTELRAKLKEEIKLRIIGDPVFNKHFKATREKYGVELVKEIPDDQLSAFYAEVLG